MSKKNQSERLTNQHEESKGVVGIFGDGAKSLDSTVGKISNQIINQLKKDFPQLSFKYKTNISKRKLMKHYKKLILN